MNFDDCIKKGLVKKTAENKAISSSLVKLANIRLEDIGKFSSTTLKVESYYEVIKELITALLAADGYKSYSHECLICYIHDKFSHKFTGMQIELIDQLRVIRNDIAYRGAFVDDDFLHRNENDILLIINTLKDLLEDGAK